MVLYIGMLINNKVMLHKKKHLVSNKENVYKVISLQLQQVNDSLYF